MDRFLIAPINSGLQTDVKPWIIPDDAFARLNNAYVFRGRVRKRFGSRYMVPSIPIDSPYEQLQSRLRINIGTTNGTTGNLPPTVVPGVAMGLGAAFSVGAQILTSSGSSGSLRSTGTTTGTYTVSGGVGTVTLTGDDTTNLSTAVYYYPAFPVMGLVTFSDGNIN